MYLYAGWHTQETLIYPEIKKDVATIIEILSGKTNLSLKEQIKELKIIFNEAKELMGTNLSKVPVPISVLRITSTSSSD